MSIAVATAADGSDWEAALLAGLGRPAVVPVEFRIVRRCVDLVELLAVAASGQAAAVLVEARLRRLDAEAVQRLTSGGVAVVGVAEPGSDADLDLLRAAGIQFLVPAGSTAEVFGTVLADAVAARSGAVGSDRGFADPVTATAGARPGEPPPNVPEPARRGSVVAVWGPTGAPGRTVTAVTLADELARLQQSALLIDADVYGGVAASMFGLLDESPGLVAACRQAQSHRLDTAGLAALCWQLGPRLRVLTGIARADRWPELRTTAVETVLQTARGLADYTVVDVGFGLETDEELSFDTIAPRRNGATLTVLDDADLVIAVGAADPIGMQRLIRGLEEFRTAEIDTPVWIVLNRVRSSAVPGDAATELGAALQRFAGRSPAALLPYDLAALDAAAAAGKTLGEAAPASPLRRAVTELAAAVAGVAPPRRGRRRK